MVSLFDLTGAFVCLILYAASFIGLTIDKIGLWFLIGLVCLFLNFLLLFAFSPESFIYRREKGGMKAWPKWAKWVSRSLALLLGLHLLMILIQGKGGVAAIHDGAFVLSARGHVIREITESEYLRFKAAELRFMSFGLLNGFCMLALEWWLPKIEIEEDSEQALTDRSSPTRG
jgi:hypothetical protein